MKSSNSTNKPNNFAGVILLLLAAFFSIALILQPIDFGNFGPGKDNFLYQLGNMLFSVYGYSSIIIPIFLFVSAISCFATDWTARMAMRLLTAVIPFFTSVGIEKLCNLILENGNSEFATLKIILTVVIGVMLIVIEIIAAGIIADKITGHAQKENTKKSEFENQFETSYDEPSYAESAYIDEFNNESEYTDYNDTENSEETLNSEENPYADANIFNHSEGYKENLQKEDDACDEYNEPSYADSKGYDPFENVFDDVENNDSVDTKNNEMNVDKEFSNEPVEEFAKATNDESDKSEGAEESEESIDEPNNEYNQKTVKNDEDSEKMTADGIPQWLINDIENNCTEDEDTTNDEIETEIEDKEEIKKKDEENPFEKPLFQENVKTEENSLDDDNSAVAPLLSQEEYAALTDFSDMQDEDADSVENDEKDEESEQDDELEWPDTEEIKAKAGFLPENDIEDGEYDDSDFSTSLETTSDEETITDNDENEMLTNNNDETESDFRHSEEHGETIQSTDNVQNVQIEKVNFRDEQNSALSSDVFSDMEKDIRAELDGKKFVFAEENSSNSQIQSEQDSLEVTGNENGTDGNGNTNSLASSFEKNDAQNQSESEISLPIPQKSSRAMPKKPYKVPFDLLEKYENDKYWVIDEDTKSDSLKLKETLNQFGIEAEIIGIKKGPVVTMFELLPAPGVKLSKIVTLQDNIALNLAAKSVRIVAPIPGRAAVGIEVPNKNRSIVSFREMVEQKLQEFEKMAVPVILGKDILGKPQLLDLVKTPHMLIAGATGAGKSVCVNSMILSILYKRSPQQVKLILIDPKVVELKLYNDIPHLLTPVITEPKRALQSLQYCLCEMERRYALLDQMGVRDIVSYNKRIEERNICTEKLPYIVVIIDEFADLMATTGKELESTIARLAAMSRAVGIHLVLATQRPSIDVITGLIKANIPTRIAFMVASKMDSRIIIDQVGAEMLLGKGDMLYASAVDPFPVRIQGTFVSDQDVENVVEFVKTYGEPDYIDDEIFYDEDEDDSQPNLFDEDGPDPLYEQALDVVIQAGKASASYIQRRLKIGYNRAARLVEEMEARGLVGPANGSKPREIIHIPS